MNSFELREFCNRETCRYIEVANTKLGLDLPYPRVEFGIRNKKVKGLAFLGKNLIKYNDNLVNFSKEVVSNVCAHEVAHLICYAKHGTKVKAHGEEWGSCLWTLGFKAERYFCGEPVPPAVVQTELGKVTIMPGVRTIEFD
jgi:predicted SprT family Zn-dependent metalloprotease